MIYKIYYFNDLIFILNNLGWSRFIILSLFTVIVIRLCICYISCLLLLLLLKQFMIMQNSLLSVLFK